MTVALGRRLSAEALGAALLLAIVVGSGIMAERLAGGDDAMALLGNTLSTSAGLFVLVLILGPVSGAHFNPAVTFVFALKREITVAESCAYVVAQTTGAIVGVALAHLMFDLAVFEVSTNERHGFGRAFAEAVATFWLVLTVLGVRSHRPEAGALAIALCIAAGYWFTSSTSFANPAVTLARTLTDTFAGVRPEDVPVFLASQIAGTLVALGTAHVLFIARRDPYRAPDAGAASTLQNAG